MTAPTPRGEQSPDSLLPCPHCGAEPWGIFGPHPDLDQWWVECHGPDKNATCGDWYTSVDATDRVAARAEVAARWNARATLPQPAAAQSETLAEQGCNCRWKDGVVTQRCELHEAWHTAIHEWAERAKTAEGKLASLPPAVRLSDSEIVAIRDEHLPSQGESFDCIAFARAILAASAPKGQEGGKPAAYYISGPYPDGNYAICELGTGRVLQLLGADDFPQPLRDAASPAPSAPAEPAQQTQGAEPHSLVGFLEKLRPLTDYGRPGTRDTEQAELRRALESAIVLARALTSTLAAAPAPEGVPQNTEGVGGTDASR